MIFRKAIILNIHWLPTFEAKRQKKIILDHETG